MLTCAPSIAPASNRTDEGPNLLRGARLTSAVFRLDVGGARAKILRHLRRREREAVLVSPYRYAVVGVTVFLTLVFEAVVPHLSQPAMGLLYRARRHYQARRTKPAVRV